MDIQRKVEPQLSVGLRRAGVDTTLDVLKPEVERLVERFAGLDAIMDQP